MEIKRLNLVTKANINVQHIFVRQDNPTGLLAILPGRGYTRDNPLLYYLLKIGIALNYDILSIQYGFQAAPHLPQNTESDVLMGEAKLALETIPKRDYGRACFAGKSLGSPLAAKSAVQYDCLDKRIILLTPVTNATQLTDGLPTLAIIGTDDYFYNDDFINSAPDNVKWEIFEGLNHGLEADPDWEQSLQILPKIMKSCERFLK